jgi:hypothetical protein
MVGSCKHVMNRGSHKREKFLVQLNISFSGRTPLHGNSYNKEHFCDNIIMWWLYGTVTSKAWSQCTIRYLEFGHRTPGTWPPEICWQYTSTDIMETASSLQHYSYETHFNLWIGHFRSHSHILCLESIQAKNVGERSLRTKFTEQCSRMLFLHSVDERC